VTLVASERPPLFYYSLVLHHQTTFRSSFTSTSSALPLRTFLRDRRRHCLPPAMAFFKRQETSPGAHRDDPSQSNSASSLVSTLVPNLVIAGVFVLCFLIFRRKFKRLYAPRTYIDSLGDHRKTPPPSSGFFAWIKDYRTIGDKYILDHQSIDAYLFVRYFKLIVIISFLGCCITWPILFPINATGGGPNKQLDILSMSNVVNVNRYYAHALVSCVFLGEIAPIPTSQY
jgi:hypothetical protein